MAKQVLLTVRELDILKNALHVQLGSTEDLLYRKLEAAQSGPEVSPRNNHNVVGFRGVWALCTVSKKNGAPQLKATHYAICEVFGPSPTWAVYTVNNRFVRFAGSRTQIEQAYPRHVWRKKSGEWNLNQVSDDTVQTRRSKLEEMYGATIEAASAVETPAEPPVEAPVVEMPPLRLVK